MYRDCHAIICVSFSFDEIKGLNIRFPSFHNRVELCPVSAQYGLWDARLFIDTYCNINHGILRILDHISVHDFRHVLFSSTRYIVVAGDGNEWHHTTDCWHQSCVGSDPGSVDKPGHHSDKYPRQYGGSSPARVLYYWSTHQRGQPGGW